MAGSAADTPTTPEFIRVSDEDRDRAVDELRREFVDGRLSHDTFMLRMHAALDARNHGQLSGLFSDLPPRASWLSRARETVRQWQGSVRERRREAGRPPGGQGQASGQGQARGWRAGRAALVPPPAGAPDWASASELAPGGAPVPLVFPPGTDTSFTIGRDQRCDLYIADMTVSRLHARLSRKADGWQLTDLGSSNGTRVNGWRLREAVPVQPGDVITFGSAVFILHPGLGQDDATAPDA